MTNIPLRPDDVGVSLDMLSEDLLKVAARLGSGYGLDPVAIAMALGFAATKGLYRLSVQDGIPEKAINAVQIMNANALRSVADMIAGSDAHPSPQ